MPDADTEISRQGQPGLGLTAAGNAAGDPGARSPRTDLLIDMQKSCDTMQIEIFPVKMQVVCISINTSYVSILSLHKTWDSLESA